MKKLLMMVVVCLLPAKVFAVQVPIAEVKKIKFECVLSWDASVSPNVDDYRIYQNEIAIVEVLNDLKYTFGCDIGVYQVTAINIYGKESELSASIEIAKPKLPLEVIIEPKKIIIDRIIQ